MPQLKYMYTFIDVLSMLFFNILDRKQKVYTAPSNFLKAVEKNIKKVYNNIVA